MKLEKDEEIVYIEERIYVLDNKKIISQQT